MKNNIIRFFSALIVISLLTTTVFAGTAVYCDFDGDEFVIGQNLITNPAGGVDNGYSKDFVVEVSKDSVDAGKALKAYATTTDWGSWSMQGFKINNIRQYDFTNVTKLRFWIDFSYTDNPWAGPMILTFFTTNNTSYTFPAEFNYYTEEGGILTKETNLWTGQLHIGGYKGFIQIDLDVFGIKDADLKSIDCLFIQIPTTDTNDDDRELNPPVYFDSFSLIGTGDIVSLSDNGNTGSSSGGGSPKTGDSIMIYLSVMLLGCSALTIAIFRKKGAVR